MQSRRLLDSYCGDEERIGNWESLRLLIICKSDTVFFMLQHYRLNAALSMSQTAMLPTTAWTDSYTQSSSPLAALLTSSYTTRLRTAASAKLSKCVCELTHLTLMSLLVRVFTKSAIAY